MASHLCIYVSNDDIARHLVDDPSAIGEVLSSLSYLANSDGDRARFFKRAVEDIELPAELLPIVEGLADALRTAAAEEN